MTLKFSRLSIVLIFLAQAVVSYAQDGGKRFSILNVPMVLPDGKWRILDDVSASDIAPKSDRLLREYKDIALLDEERPNRLLAFFRVSVARPTGKEIPNPDTDECLKRVLRFFASMPGGDEKIKNSIRSDCVTTQPPNQSRSDWFDVDGEGMKDVVKSAGLSFDSDVAAFFVSNGFARGSRFSVVGFIAQDASLRAGASVQLPSSTKGPVETLAASIAKEMRSTLDFETVVMKLPIPPRLVK